MQLGNISDLIANISLAWLSSLCLFWSMALIMMGGIVERKSVRLFGWSLILTSFYFGTISISTGVMIQYRVDAVVTMARWIIFVDMVTKTALTIWFLYRQKIKGQFLEGDGQ